MALNGTYDVLTVPLLLPRAIVESLLPPNIRNATPTVLLPIPTSVLSTCQRPSSSTSSPPAAPDDDDDDDQRHLILLQLGSQSGAGPGIVGMTFQEAKLEIPYIRHIKCNDQQRAFQFKQKCIFSNRIVSISAQHLTGLHSSLATFTPPQSPWQDADGAETIEYAAEGFFNVTAQIMHQGEERQTLESQAATTFKRLSEAWWYGDRTGSVITKFDFAEPSIGPTAYNVTLRLNLGAFRHDAQSSEGAMETYDTIGVRSRSRYVAKVDKI